DAVSAGGLSAVAELLPRSDRFGHLPRLRRGHGVLRRPVPHRVGRPWRTGRLGRTFPGRAVASGARCGRDADRAGKEGRHDRPRGPTGTVGSARNACGRSRRRSADLRPDSTGAPASARHPRLTCRAHWLTPDEHLTTSSDIPWNTLIVLSTTAPP